jgi:hypothetical protein
MNRLAPSEKDTDTPENPDGDATDQFQVTSVRQFERRFLSEFAIADAQGGISWSDIFAPSTGFIAEVAKNPAANLTIQVVEQIQETRSLYRIFQTRNDVAFRSLNGSIRQGGNMHERIWREA